nr:p6 protein [Cucurbit chlorotic yellows virus]
MYFTTIFYLLLGFICLIIIVCLVYLCLDLIFRLREVSSPCVTVPNYRNIEIA